MARKSAPITLVVHYPATEEGQRKLRERVASVHADAVGQYIKRLKCPSKQKEQLYDAIIQTLKDQMKEG